MSDVPLFHFKREATEPQGVVLIHDQEQQP